MLQLEWSVTGRGLLVKQSLTENSCNNVFLHAQCNKNMLCLQSWTKVPSVPAQFAHFKISDNFHLILFSLTDARDVV